jgi:hypothetical protein
LRHYWLYLLTGSKRELGAQARIAPDTQNASLRLSANLQIARARFALGDSSGALEMLGALISESNRLGYAAASLETRLAQAEIELQSDPDSAGRTQIEEIGKQAEAMGLNLIANTARSLSK